MKLGIPYKVGDGPWRMDVPLMRDGDTAYSATEAVALSAGLMSVFRYASPGDGWLRRLCSRCADRFYVWSKNDLASADTRCDLCNGMRSAAEQSRYTETIEDGIARRNL